MGRVRSTVHAVPVRAACPKALLRPQILNRLESHPAPIGAPREGRYVRLAAAVAPNVTQGKRRKRGQAYGGRCSEKCACPLPSAETPFCPHCTTLVDGAYNWNMPTRTKAAPASKAKAVRQSVTIPAPLVATVRREAKQRHLTMSRALVSLAERGARADLDAKANLKATYKRFMDEREPTRKSAAGEDLIRAVFGKDAIAEDPVL